jgi:hypothetical protein
MAPIRSLAFLTLSAFAANAWAARPMVTDDARIVDAKACQVESWVRAERHGSNQFWAVPACTPVENLEITVGASLERSATQERMADSLLQFKSLLRPLRTNDWGLALSLIRSVERGIDPGTRDVPSHALNLPLSVSLRDDALVLHVNAGLRDDRVARRTYATWGLASELVLRDRLQLITETYGESGQRPFAHGGLRYWLVPDKVQIDTTVGTRVRAGHGERWFTIGVRLLSPAFLP